VRKVSGSSVFHCIQHKVRTLLLMSWFIEGSRISCSGYAPKNIKERYDYDRLLGKDSTLVSIKTTSGTCLTEVRKITRNPSSDNGPPSRYSNEGLPDY
jgi:hypothetical protein